MANATSRPADADARADESTRASIVLRLVVAVIAVVSFFALAAAVQQSQDHAERDAIARFGLRAPLTAQLISASLAQSASAQADRGSQQFAGDITADDFAAFDEYLQAPTSYLAVTDATGAVIAESAPSALDGRRAEVSAAAADAAEAESFGSSELTDEGIVEFYLPIRTDPGDELRVIVLAYPLVTVQVSLGGLLSDVYASDEAAYVLDDTGAVVVTASAALGAETAPPEIRRAVVAERRSGTYDDRRFVVQPIEGTRLVHVLDRSEAQILALLPARIWAQLSLLALAAALVMALLLMVGMQRTSRRLAAARRDADAANAAKSRMVAHVTHELRTPISVLRGFAGLLATSPLSDDQRAHAARIVDSGEHLSQLVDELLDVSSIEAGKVKLELEPLDVHDAVDEAIGLVDPLASDHDIDVVSPEREDGAVGVAADRVRLRQVLFNLLSNAIKYSDPGSTVRCEIEPTSDEYVTVLVRDSGRGIAPEDLPRLFEPFERIQPTSGVGGSGLGLSVSKGLVEAMGGSMHASSRPGTGSTFEFRLPAATVGDRIGATDR